MAAGTCILVIGPTPPPYNGMSVATGYVLDALGEDLQIVRLDTADRRGLSNIGKFELENLLLGGRHGVECCWLLVTKRPRIVYVPISQAWLPFLRDCLFLIPARVVRRKVIIHLHGGYFGKFYRETSSLMRWIIRYALGKASTAIVLGKNVVDSFDGILLPERIRVIPNGIPDYFADGEQNENEHHISRLLYLGSLDARKGILDLLYALYNVKRHTDRFLAVFAGEWFSKSDKIEAGQIMERFNLGKHVQFVGPIGLDRKCSLLREADFLAFPTKYQYEGHPYVILEAMAAGLPVISTRVACIPETIRDGEEGFLVDPGDVEALADRIELLLRDNDARTRMGKAARQRFLEEYTHEKFAARMKAVFAEVQAGH